MPDDLETVVGTSGLECPQCKCINPLGAIRCEKCNTPLTLNRESVTTTGGAAAASGWSVPVGAHVAASSLAALKPGSLLGGRYEIIQLLGEGGMGAVYKARDTELDRLVALKVIRPELAGRPEILQRFKQELILARQVTHKNVIRIFDLGQAEGMKFITMEFVQGEDLKHVLRARGKLPPEEAAKIMRQVCAALEAAHVEGVVHRDLKPPNIMMDESGRALVMDFGIARSMEAAGAGLTQTGALMGTPEYMSPEQAKGEKVDPRSDLFTLGIIFYELITGKSPYKADTAIHSLLKRIQERAAPPVEADPTIPQDLSDIVMKCLAINPDERYQSATDLARELDLWMGVTPAGTTQITVIEPPPRMIAALRHWKWAAVGLAASLAIVASLFIFREKTVPKATPKQKVVTMLVADFDNQTGEPVFDGTLEPMLTLALEGASFISTPIRRDQALTIASQLQAGANKLGEPLARLVAGREGVSVVVSGSIARQGDGYAIAVKAIDAVTGKLIASQEIDAASKEKVLATVGKLAAPIRKALGDTTPESTQLEAAETFTAGSVEAAHHYAIAQQLQYQGKMEEASRSYFKAIELDPNMGRAYSGVATVYRNLGRRQDAEKYFKEALARIDRMTDREKYRTRGMYYTTIGSQEKSLEEYKALVSKYPADTAGHANMAIVYSGLRNMPQALQEARLAIELNPRSVPQRYNLAVIALYAGDLQTADREARAALDLNPSYAKAFIALALTKVAQGQPAEGTEIYRRLEKLSAFGASYATAGLADLALFEGRFSEGAAILEDGARADLTNNNPAYAASKFMHLAEAQLLRGQKGPAQTAAERALAWSKDPNVLFSVGRFYVQAGLEAKARPLIAQLAARLESEPQSYAKLVEGEALLKHGNAREALKSFQEGQKMLDTWIARFLLGRAYLELGAFPEADSEFELCLKRRGEAFILFRDEIPTSWLVPPAHYYLGRAREGLNSPGAAESYRTFLSIREKAGEDPLIADARKRLAGR